MNPREKFKELIDNLWYTWHPSGYIPIIDLYGDGWRRNPPPLSFIQEYGVTRLEKLLESRSGDIDNFYEQFQRYLNEPKWFDEFKAKNSKFQNLATQPIAYFCMEYGLVDWLQIYSGGLGVLAGDYLKEASDLGVPLVAVGIFYHQGYFHQDFDESGMQIDRYLTQDYKDFPFETVKDEQGKELLIEIEIIDHIVYVRAHKLKVGNVELFLLDTNIDENHLYEDRMISAHLYGGDQDTRIRQEILLGIGGARLLTALKINPSIWHMNEGHSGFLSLELAQQYLRENPGQNFETALDEVDERLVFTNHTLKQAGNDVFPYLLMEKYLSAYTDDLKTDINAIDELGKDSRYAQGEFSMTILGLRSAKISNAVSLLHGQVAKKIWPDYELVPITNGIHVPTWLSKTMFVLLEKYLGHDWHKHPELNDYKKILKIPYSEVWYAHTVRKEKLINSLNTELGFNLNPQALTIAWSRRLTAYKRPDLIISDLERLGKIVNAEGMPVQILIAGKAHPRDEVGKKLLQEINNKLCDVCNSEIYSKVVIIPGYNWALAKRMVSGADVWLNTPYRYEEASGTSGMKAALNGVLQLTTLDGWTDEVDWYDKGWVISEEDPVKSLHDTLEYKISPLYFDRNLEGYNDHWVRMMLNSMVLILEQYSATRMFKQYISDIYEKILP